MSCSVFSLWVYRVFIISAKQVQTTTMAFSIRSQSQQDDCIEDVGFQRKLSYPTPAHNPVQGSNLLEKINSFNLIPLHLWT